MISNIMYDLLHFGFWQFDNNNLNPLIAMELKLANHFDESEIVNIKNWPQADATSAPIIRTKRPEWESPSCASTVRISNLNSRL